MKTIFHIGVHKTATTHIQDTFELHRQDLKDRNIRYLPRDLLREKANRFISCISKFDRFVFFRDRVVERKMRSIFSRLTAPDDACVLISEENLIGSSRDLLASKVYPDMEMNLRAIRSIVEHQDYMFYVAIRNFRNIIPSAYSQVARGGKVHPGGIDKISADILAEGRTWKDFFVRLFAVIPSDRVRIYKYEDYFDHSQEILLAIAGLKSGDIDFNDIHAPASTKSLSAETLAAIENLPRWKTKAQRGRLAEDLSRNDAGKNKFRPFSREAEALFDLSYESDIAWIQKNYPHSLMRFGEQISG